VEHVGKEADAGALLAYRLERTRLLARRVPTAALSFLVSVGIAAALDWSTHPDRRSLLLLVYGAQAAAAALAVWAAGRLAPRPSVEGVASLFACVLTLLATTYLVLVGAPLEQLAVAQLGFLAGASVLLPWTWRAQAAMSACVATAFVVAAPLMQGNAEPLVLGLPVVVLGALTAGGSYHLERYRREAFLRSAREAEEARITASLAHVGDTLHAHLDAPDMLARLSALAREQLTCDWSAVYLRDATTGSFRLRALSGPVTDEERAQLSAFEFDRETLPLLRLMDDHDLTEIPDAARDPHIGPELAQRFHIASALYTAVRGRDGVTGTLAHGRMQQIGPFTPRQRRLALGIAKIAAIAIENARLIDQLAAASRLKSEFVATMSHELRTPLNVITGYTDLLADGVFGALSAEQHDTVRRIRQSGCALLELVNMTLDLSRLENGREPLRCEAVDLADLVGELRLETAPLAASGVSLSWSVAPGTVVETDRAKLKTIAKNLVGNALKFTSRGRVEVTLVWSDGALCLTVHDTGIGIAAEHLPVIFEMFRQVDGSATRRFDGVGLGLHIVERFTALLGGTVTVESSVGEGSTFRVTLPCASVSRREMASGRRT
jgi:signal transduction histidine kinase